MAGAGHDILESGQRLTRRQAEVVRLAVSGLTAKETARRLGISKNTVDEHLREARRRVGAATKSQLIGWAVASGIVSD
jgi:DNA-binding CsgD family transcriptional regulator